MFYVELFTVFLNLIKLFHIFTIYTNRFTFFPVLKKWDPLFGVCDTMKLTSCVSVTNFICGVTQNGASPLFFPNRYRQRLTTTKIESMILTE